MKKLLSRIKLDLIDTIVLVFYYLFICFLFLGLFGFFNRLAVSFVIFVLLLGLLFLRNYIAFSKKYLWFFLFVPIVAAGFGFLRGSFTGDAYGLWLPVARDIVQTGYFPGFSFSYFFARMPLLSLLLAATFSISNSFKEILCAWIPFFFATATLIVVYQWTKEKNLTKKFLFFIPFLFLTNIIVQFFGSWNLLQESLILFFATTFFYYYEKYLVDRQIKNLILLILSFILASASKISGLFLFLIILFLFFKTKEKKKLLSFLFFLSVPVIFWLIRNYLVFGNPFYPSFESIFKGRYYEIDQLYWAHYTLPEYITSIWDKYLLVVKEYLWMAFPFIVLSLYGFIKERRYDFLFLIISYSLIKEMFLFNPTDSSARYYYLFLGLFLVYALLGLEHLRSRLFTTFLLALAMAGLLLVPVTDSTSQFISLFENKLSLFGQIFNYLHNYWYLLLIILIPFIYWVSRKEDIKIFLIFFYCFYILHLEFVANKSWFNTWPFISLFLLFFILFIFKKKIRYLKTVIIALIILTVFTNSWAMGAVYYWHQGEFSFPVKHIWQVSEWARTILDKREEPAKRNTFSIIISGQPDYFIWRTDYQSINLFRYGFWAKLGDYKSDLSDYELWQLLRNNNIKYVIKNESDLSGYVYEHENFFEKVGSSKYFNLIAIKENKYAIWQVY